jgi:hypothetical protein
MLNVVCINAGNYQSRGAEYVNALHRMVKEHLSVPFRFVCFTDQFGGLFDTGGDLRPLPDPSFKRWWHKLSLFRPGVFEEGDRVLYFDLSTVIMRNLDDLAAYDGHFCMTQSFGATGPFGGLQSNVMAWRAGFGGHIYQSYLRAGCPEDFAGGDQAWIENLVSHPDTWDDICPGKVVSYKFGLHGEHDGNASVVCFHGYPKPHEAGGWAEAAWSGSAGEEIELMLPVKFVDVCNTDEAQLDENIRLNTLRKHPSMRMRDAHDVPAVIVGGGPSVAVYIGEIQEKQDAGAAVFALNGSAKWLYGNGITPDYHVIMDARPENQSFLGWAMLPVPLRTTFLMADQCHPSLFGLLHNSARDVRLWHVHGSGESLELVRRHDEGAQFVSAGVTVGISVLNLAWMMGFRHADLYGYDSSSAGEDEHHAYPQPLNDAAKTEDYLFEGKVYRAQRALASQAQHFVTFYQMWEKVGLKIDVHGEGLLPDLWRSEERTRAKCKGSLEGEEAYKYRRCWQTREYREYSPGVILIDQAIEALNPHRGARFIDFGCGTGRPAQRLADRGFDVLCIDHASNCLDPEILLPLCVANLWALPEGIEPADYGYCTDVMEHIHEHKVPDVFANIARHVKKAVFFNIAKHEVEFGHNLGVGALHVTQKDAEWWGGKLAPYFSNVEHKGGGIFVCHK